MPRNPRPKTLVGWRVLVPRGGEWGDGVAASLRRHGATPVVAPLINFASTDDPDALVDALARLQSGDFDWLVVTSATTVDVLHSHSVQIPASTRIAASGDTARSALALAGYAVDFSPERDNSPRGLVREWPPQPASLRVLVLGSDADDPTIAEGLIELGHAVETVNAYRTIGVAAEPKVAADVASGNIRAVLITSGRVAAQVRDQLAPLPKGTVVAAIGPRTAWDSRTLGISVDVIADTLSAEGLIDALVDYARTHHRPQSD